MVYLNLIQLILSVLSGFVKRAYNQDLLEAGQYEAIAKASQEVLSNVQKAKDAVSRAKHDANISKQLRDKYKIDDK